MSARARALPAEAGGIAPPATVKVWDPFVRVFHWSLLALFVAAHVTGDHWEQAHIVVGYTITALLSLRIVWGFVGPRHARFADFVRGPRKVLAYLRDAALLKAPRHLGHNPAGGAMVIALLLSLALTCITGVLMTSKSLLWGVKWVEEVHEALAHLSIGLVVLHVIGVIASSLLHGENLISSMITGRKRVN